MKEREQIIDLWTRMERAGQGAVLATVVNTRGSSYRLPGARLLLTADGQRAGSVSGGCLEDDLIKKGWWLTERSPVVRRYDTTPNGEIAAEFGLGCNGIIYVLLERLRPGEATVLEVIREVRAKRQPAVIAHVIEPAEAVGQKLIIDTEGRARHDLVDSECARAIEQEAQLVLAERGSRSVRAGGLEAFIETIAPAVRLLIFGAGDDAVPMASLAKQLGWHVSVFDGRAHYARREKFSAADEVLVRPAGQSGAAIDPWTVAILMSHSYQQDLDTLCELSARPPRYLGILGPRKRTTQLIADAGLDPTTLAALHSPMGLDIGADGPEQVALAALAEIQAILNGREGGLLRERAGSIHAREDDSATAAELWVRSIACA